MHLVSPRDAVLSPRIPPRQVLDGLKYHRGTLNIYAVRVGEQCAIRYAVVDLGTRDLRRHKAEWPVELVEIGTGRSFAKYIIRRVCHVAFAACAPDVDRRVGCRVDGVAKLCYDSLTPM